jgi:hypothetical protein
MSAPIAGTASSSLCAVWIGASAPAKAARSD